MYLGNITNNHSSSTDINSHIATNFQQKKPNLSVFELLKAQMTEAAKVKVSNPFIS